MLKAIKRWSRHRSPVIAPFLLGAGCSVVREILQWVFPWHLVVTIGFLTTFVLTLLILNYPFLSYRRTRIVTTCIVAGVWSVTLPLWDAPWSVWTPKALFGTIAGIVSVWLVLLGLVTAAVAIRRATIRHHGLGRCRKCGYSRAGLAGDACPECGTAIIPSEILHAVDPITDANERLRYQYLNLGGLHHDETNRQLVIPFACTSAGAGAESGDATASPHTPLFAARLRIEQVLSYECRDAAHIEVYTLNRLEVMKDPLIVYLVANEDLLIEIKVAAVDIHVELSTLHVGEKRTRRFLGVIELERYAQTQIDWPRACEWTAEASTQ